ncbi:hypothetical protein CYMTET_7730 [Cymbomonas tetramitiformis]|uniref:Uncharacterized protein n=1 Tax=Cymbomonas tetramitiformis TaxID=36881 RepID=A0AAE0LH73_9CHLO|nr:hypothetical protein CYMTET_7730 [Cymbomonas tetramitiformis]
MRCATWLTRITCMPAPFFGCSVDEEAAIRANTTICLGNIARYLSEAAAKRVLLNAFTRALRDQFAPARAAGLMAITATMGHYDADEAARRIIPAARPLPVLYT